MVIIKKEEPRWRKRIRHKLEMCRADLGRVNRCRKGELRNENVKLKLERVYHIERGVETIHEIHEMLRQRVVALNAKLKRYDAWCTQHR